MLNSSRVSCKSDLTFEKIEEVIEFGFCKVVKSYPIEIGVYEFELIDLTKFVLTFDVIFNVFGLIFNLSAPHLLLQRYIFLY